MRFWVRELAGWLLILLGLFLAYVCVALLLNNQFFAGGPLSILAIIIFRGGIHLLKVAMAARACFYSQAEIQRQRRRPKKSLPKTDGMPLDW